jgi:Transposase
LEEELVMSIKRYKAEQIVTMLRQIEVSIANGKTTPPACKEAEITMQTFYRWRKEYGGANSLAATLCSFVDGGY